MPRPQDEQVSLAEQIAQLVEEGVTSRRDQAAELGLPYSTLMRRLSRENLTDRASLEEWIPWSFTAEHHRMKTAKRLRILAQAADRRPTRFVDDRSKTVRWAQRLVDQGEDIAYSRDEGFTIVPARPDSWYLKRLLDAAVRFIADLEQLDDLGRDTG